MTVVQNAAILYKKTYQEFTKDYSLKHLTPVDGPVNGYGGSRVENIGLVTLYLWHGRNLYPIDFKISNMEYITPLGGEECEEMGKHGFMVQVKQTRKRFQILPKNPPKSDETVAH